MTTKKPGIYSSLLSLDNEVKKKPKPPIKKLNVASKIEPTKVNRRSRSRSPRNKKMKPSSMKAPFEDISIDWDIPDRQYGDLYCKPCDSHMNSEQMWEAHIQGKRHLKNVKKKGEAGDLKYDYVDEDPIMIKLLNAETRPIVGLQHVVEIQRLEQRPIYQCFLCSANVPTAAQLVDHIVGTKHRLAYLKEHDPERHALVQKSNLKKGHIEPVVEECIEKHEANIGRGKMLVKREREDYISPPRKSYKPDYAGPSKSNRSPEPKRSKPDRSFDSFDDHSSQGRFTDRDDSYYNRTDGLAESYSRSGYNDRLSDVPPGNKYKSNERSRCDEDRYGDSRFPLRDLYGSLLSPDGKYGGSRSSAADDRYGSSRPSVAEDRYGSSRPPVAEDRYGSSRPAVADDRYGSSRPPVADDRYGSSRPPVADDRYASSRPSLADDRYASSRPSVVDDRYTRSLVEEDIARYRTSMDEDKYGDLREVLEKKKTSTDPDAYLNVIESMNASTFLKIAIFKINRIEINNESELQLLERLSGIISSMVVQIKKSQLKEACPTDLKELFKESMAVNGIDVPPKYAKDYQQIIEMVGQAKANSKPVNSDENSAQQLNYEAQYSTTSYGIPTLATTDRMSAAHQRSGSSYATATPNRIPGFSWQHVDSTQAQPAAADGYSSTSYIPGLTLTSDRAAAEASQSSSPFDLLARQAKDILGGIRTQTDSYRY